VPSFGGFSMPDASALKEKAAALKLPEIAIPEIAIPEMPSLPDPPPAPPPPPPPPPPAPAYKAPPAPAPKAAPAAPKAPVVLDGKSSQQLSSEADAARREGESKAAITPTLTLS
jgi:hypothetical protein